jgi:hypothetical protein
MPVPDLGSNEWRPEWSLDVKVKKAASSLSRVQDQFSQQASKEQSQLLLVMDRGGAKFI